MTPCCSTTTIQSDRLCSTTRILSNPRSSVVYRRLNIALVVVVVMFSRGRGPYQAPIHDSDSHAVARAHFNSQSDCGPNITLTISSGEFLINAYGIECHSFFAGLCRAEVGPCSVQHVSSDTSSVSPHRVSRVGGAWARRDGREPRPAT
jgi:hypothetical protein